MNETWSALQLAKCQKYHTEPYPISDDQKLGIALNVRTDLQPLNGLRHPAAGDTCGWYLWAGEELSKSPDFFVPIHVAHMDGWRPDAISFLQLPPGWRFIIAPGYEDVWFDDSLLEV